MRVYATHKQVSFLLLAPFVELLKQHALAEGFVFRLSTQVEQTKIVPYRIRTVDLRIPRSDALPPSHRDSLVT